MCVCADSDIGGPVDPNELVPRRVGEAIGSTVGTLATLVNYPIGKHVNNTVFVCPIHFAGWQPFWAHKHRDLSMALPSAQCICHFKMLFF